MGCLVERRLLSEGRRMDKPASCTPTPSGGKRKGVFVLAQVRSSPVLMFYMLLRRRASGSKVAGSEGRGDIMASFL